MIGMNAILIYNITVPVDHTTAISVLKFAAEYRLQPCPPEAAILRANDITQGWAQLPGPRRRRLDLVYLVPT